MRSHLLHGVVRHRRARPFTYGLEHGVFYAALDLDELDEVDRVAPAVPAQPPRASSRSATTTTSSRRRPTSARRSSTTCARRARIRRGWRITLVANLRVAGYVFDPASFFLCRDADGVLRVVVVEVHNTHGERHLYTLRPRDRRLGHVRRPRWTRRSTSRRSSRCAAATRSASATSRSRLRITINQHQPEGLELHASLDLARRPLTDRNLLRLVAAPPVPDPPDDGPHPLARAAAVAARRPLPSTQRGRPMSSPTLAASARRRARSSSTAWPGGSRSPRPSASGSGACVVVLPDGTRPDVRRTTRPSRQREIRIHDRRALARILVGGETGGGEAYMDGLWSSPDLAGLLRWAALNRESLSLSAGWFRRPGPASRGPSPTASAATRRARAGATSPPTTTSATTSTGLFLDETMTYSSAVFAVARPVPGRRAAQQVPAHGGQRRPGPRPARPRDRHGLGRVRAVRGRRAGLPGDHDHDLAGAVRPGPRARPGRGAGAPRGRPAARLPGHRGHVRRDRLDRDARSRRRRVLRDVLRGLRSGARPGRSAEPPVDHVPGRRVRAAAPRRELDPDVHLPGRPVPIAGRHRAVHARHVPPRPRA